MTSRRLTRRHLVGTVLAALVAPSCARAPILGLQPTPECPAGREADSADPLDHFEPNIISDAVKFGDLNVRRKRGERDMNAVYDGMRALATNIKRDAELALTLLRGL